MRSWARILTAGVATVAIGTLAGCSTPTATTARLAATHVTPLHYAIVGDANFRAVVTAILYSPNSWTSDLVALADSGPIDFYIWLAYPELQPPCWDCNSGNMVAIGTEAWFNGAHKGPGLANELFIPVPEWRRFIINHEVGHRLGNPDHSGPCSVMNPRVCPAEWPTTVDDYQRARAREWLATRSTV